MGQQEHASPWSVPGLALSILHLLANLVAQDLVPVNLGPSDWELAT